MTTAPANAELLATIGRGRLGRIDLVRITPSGRATRREALFERGVLARSWRAGIAPAVALTRAPGARLRRMLTSPWS